MARVWLVFAGASCMAAICPLPVIARSPAYELIEARFAEIGRPVFGPDAVVAAADPPAAPETIAVPDDGCPQPWKTVCSEWSKSLRLHPRYASFLEGHPLLFRFAEPNWFTDRRILATWEEDGIYLNAAKLRSVTAQLMEEGVDPSALPRTTALKTLWVIAHELEHGINSEALRLATGIRFPAGFLEDEYLATAGGAEALRDLQKSHPELFGAVEMDSDHREILRQLRKGPGALLRSVRRRDPDSVSIISTSRETLLSANREKEDVLRRYMLHYSAPNVAGGEMPLEVVGRWHQKTVLIIQCLEDDGKFAQVLDFFKARMTSK